MHYRDGTEARVGDLVRGKGYNVKGPDGELLEIQGVVVGLTPGTDTCNLRVAHPEVRRSSDGVEVDLYPGPSSQRCVALGGLAVVRLSTEYGQADHFDLVRRAPD